MSTQPSHYITREEYLAIERAAETKSEYWDGVMYAMAGARRGHNLITMNAGASLHQQVRGRKCEVYSNDMRVLTPQGLYTYPDVAVACGEPKFEDDVEDTLVNPVLIIEVLSRSTPVFDRGRKFEMYRAIPSLREYLMLSSERVHAELYIRQRNGEWVLRDASRLEDELELEYCGCRLKLADLYENVTFPRPTRPAAI